MMKKVYYLLFLAILGACSKGEKVTYAMIETSLGNMKVELYNETPKHRDNFIKMANEEYYDSLLFHRIIPNFMIQGGDPDSRNAAPGQMLGMGGPNHNVDAEFGQPHFKGALSAARQPDGVNPQKKSSGSQFFIVHGNTVDDNFLSSIERQKGIQYNSSQREIYKTKGGYPSLDMEYSVFGMVVEGLDVIDKIAAVQTDPNNRPFQDIYMKVKIL